MSRGSVTPGGAQTRSKAPGVWGRERYALWADGAKVEIHHWGQFTDWICALAAVGIGYEGGCRGQMILPLPSLMEQAAAEALLEVLPQQTGWDQVRWVTTGSEATLGAMMIARRATGRRKVISVGYHGWHEAHLAGRDLVALPIDSWHAYDCVDGDVAAVLVEPMRNDAENQEDRRWYLMSLETACRSVGALFIVDEIVTGFRYAVGGATELYGLKPDLAVYGKAMSNGYPIAAIVGHHSLMKHAVDISGTYNGWPPALAAVLNTVKVYKEQDVVGHMWKLGERLLKQCPMLTGWPCHPVFAEAKDYTTSERALPWVEKAEARGHLLHPSGLNVMLAHTVEDVDSLAAALTS